MKIIECPRDAMQGIAEFIPTETKINYINTLLQCGFDTIDFGSFVSPKAIPQLADTAQVLEGLNLENTSTKLLAIIANERGAKDACQFEKIKYLGFPFSLSETFQQRNTNASQEEAMDRIKRIQELAIENNKILVVYLSMGFGNPYGDVWNKEIIQKWVKELNELEIKIISLADTVGIADPKDVSEVFNDLIPTYDNIEFGAHFHSKPGEWRPVIEAAVNAGCRRFDTSLKGIGGCPMADDELVGNIATEQLLMYMGEKELDFESLKQDKILDALKEANQIFLPK